MPFLLLILFFLLPTAGSAQKMGPDTLIRYFDATLQPVKKRDGVYAGMLVRDPLGWNAIVYDQDMKVLMRGKYMDDQCRHKNGWFIYYDAQGKPAVSGRYADNRRHDNWRSFYPSGQTKDSLYFVNEVLEGGAVRYFQTGKVESEGKYKAGQPEGEWRWYHRNGYLATLERYEQGKLNFLECYDSTGKTLGMNCAISRRPELKGRYGGIEKYLQDSVRFPDKAMEDQGTVIVSFGVDELGVMSEPVILHTSSEEFSSEVLKVLRTTPAFYPAVFHNRNVAHQFTLRVPFARDVRGLPVEVVDNLSLIQQ